MVTGCIVWPLSCFVLCGSFLEFYVVPARNLLPASLFGSGWLHISVRDASPFLWRYSWSRGLFCMSFLALHASVCRIAVLHSFAGDSFCGRFAHVRVAYFITSLTQVNSIIHRNATLNPNMSTVIPHWRMPCCHFVAASV